MFAYRADGYDLGRVKDLRRPAVVDGEIARDRTP
jgi:hypothetical protein